jgi:4-hydroxybenzoate polyprenyltransferase
VSAVFTAPGPIGRALAFVRFSHTVFALPFALGALFVAAGGWPGVRLLGLVVAAMVCARTAAMCFNRLADWELDQRNPRTRARHQLLPKPAAWLLFASAAAGFVAVSALINRTCLWLSPVALFLVCFYSLTKRFTHASHFFLGLALAASPAAAWIAATGTLAAPALPLALGVLLWVAGFDLIYAAQDADFDRREGLHSLVVAMGTGPALRLAGILHLGAFACLAAFGALAKLGSAYWAALAGIAVALAWEHRIVARLDPARPDAARIQDAFFHSNAAVGGLFAAGTIAATLLR